MEQATLKILKKNLPVIGMIIGGYLFLWFSAVTNSDHHYTLCPFKNITGYPCPGCGMGRASIELFQGHLYQSLHFHWWAIPFHIAVIISFGWIIYDTVKRSDSYWKFIEKPMSTWMTVLLAVLILVNWVRALYLDL